MAIRECLAAWRRAVSPLASSRSGGYPLWRSWWQRFSKAWPSWLRMRLMSRGCGLPTSWLKSSVTEDFEGEVRSGISGPRKSGCALREVEGGVAAALAREELVHHVHLPRTDRHLSGGGVQAKGLVLVMDVASWQVSPSPR
jgi:hypothetical protein